VTALPGRIVEAGDEHKRAGLVRALISRVGDCLVTRGVKGTFSDRVDAHLANAVDDPGGNSPGLATSLDFAPQSVEIASLRARGCGAREVTPGCRPVAVGEFAGAGPECRDVQCSPTARGPGPFTAQARKLDLARRAATVFSAAGRPLCLSAVIDCLCTRSAGHRSACLIR
jgi:hypothetical protein